MDKAENTRAQNPSSKASSPTAAEGIDHKTESPPTLEPLRSIHTTTFPELLKQLNLSVVVSTYQAGKVVVLRADDGQLNTHFRIFDKPMGLAVNNKRLAIGTRTTIWDLWNVPAVAPKVEPADKHDACYLPRNTHITGDIDIHEMAWGNEGLWFVNTRFCCLCTLSSDHSFIPRWRPDFISSYAPEDRCHLNGLALVNGHPKYVTALGTSNEPRGWRPNKASGGVIIDIETHQHITEGLSMPHSPRWYRGHLWVLESGKGSLSVVDLASGETQIVAQMPGFTRGLDFCGPFAFVGLSQVRETAIFGSIPITEEVEERTCGVWVINIETGKTVAFVKFEAAVQEIFAVQTIPGIAFPEIINEQSELLASAYVLPDEALAEVAYTASEP
ncbi:MAG: TIGR03032 family protein [Cyanobacteria bacterium J06560_2]